jgi:hypothetical protein
MATSDDKGREIAIAVHNASGIVLSVYSFRLSEGAWGSKPGQEPVLGDTICSGGARGYLNMTDQPFTGVGGSITLTPANGGVVSINWSWRPGEPAKSSAYGQDMQGISVDSRWTGQGSTSMTLQVSINRLGDLATATTER